MAESHSIEERSRELLIQRLPKDGRTVTLYDRKPFDLIVDGRYAELKAKSKPYSDFDFFWISKSQYEAALADPDFKVFLVCNVDPCGVDSSQVPEIFEISAARLKAIAPKSELQYFYDKGLVKKLLEPDDEPAI